MKKVLATVSTVALSAAMLAGNVMTTAAYDGQNSDVVVTTAGQDTAKSTVSRTGISAQLKAQLKEHFDAKYYAKMNPDVKAAFGESEDALFNHFVVYGIWEGRQFNADFNVNAYASAYVDLQKAFAEQSAAQQIISYYQHYFNFVVSGIEKRTITTIEKAADAGIIVKSYSADAAYSGTVLAKPVVKGGQNNQSEEEVTAPLFEDEIIFVLENYISSAENIVKKYCDDEQADNILSTKPEDDLVMQFGWAETVIEYMRNGYEPEDPSQIDEIVDDCDAIVDFNSYIFYSAYSQGLSLPEYMMSFYEFQKMYADIDEMSKEFDGPVYDEERYNAEYKEWLETKPDESASEHKKMMYVLMKPEKSSYYTDEFRDYYASRIDATEYFGPYTLLVLFES